MTGPGGPPGRARAATSSRTSSSPRAGERALPPTGLAIAGAVLVVEVLSPSNRSHDLKRKAAVYREAGVPEIVFVDDRDKVLIVERLVGDGYETRRIDDGPWDSSAVDGFWIDVALALGRPAARADEPASKRSSPGRRPGPERRPAR